MLKSGLSWPLIFSSLCRAKCLRLHCRESHSVKAAILISRFCFAVTWCTFWTRIMIMRHSTIMSTMDMRDTSHSRKHTRRFVELTRNSSHPICRTWKQIMPENFVLWHTQWLTKRSNESHKESINESARMRAIVCMTLTRTEWMDMDWNACAAIMKPIFLGRHHSEHPASLMYSRV